MKIANIYTSHHGADSKWENSNAKLLFTRIFSNPEIKVGKSRTTVIREHVTNVLRENGWILNFPIDQSSQLTVSAMLDRCAFQLQTGNVARAAYDLLKIQHLYQSNKIDFAVLAVPSKDAANLIGDNIANSERIVSELSILDRLISVPLIVIAFE